MMIKLTEAQDNALCPKEEWLPETWEKRGYERNWGGAAVMSEYFEVLRKEAKGMFCFVTLCPTFLRRPLEIQCHTNAWGIY